MSFLLDKKFSEKYEQYFAEIGGLNWYQSRYDDHGVDIYSDDKQTIIDVKCYATPQFVKHFTGAFIETYLPLSGRDGWLYDENKLTTHYILLQDCSRENVSYWKGWYIARDALKAAMEAAEDEGDLLEKSIRSGSGYILPYEYLDQYCIECWYGDKHSKEQLESA